MIFQCFSETVDFYSSLTVNVNRFIEQQEKNGYFVVKQETLMQPHPKLQDLIILISVWMEKKDDEV